MNESDPARVRVLAAEDSPTQAAFLRRSLEQAGFDVSLARNGLEALALARRESFDVVVSDVVMPELGGYDLCRGLKAVLPELPVILLTGLDDPLDVVHAREAGAAEFVRKPYDPAEIVSCVRAVLSSGARPSTGAEAGRPPLEYDGELDDPEPTPPADPADPLDRSMIAALEELAATFESGDFAEVMGTFESAVASSYGLLETAVADGRTSEVVQISHELAGTSGSFGAHVVSSTCRQLEHHARAGDLSDARPLVWAIRAQLDVALHALREVFPSNMRSTG